MTAVFVSDLHLCPTRPVITGLFFDFLAECLRDVDHLYILGDLFEYWVGDDAIADPFNAEVCRQLKRSGVPTSVVVGNRDFLLGEQFEQSSGCHLLADETIVEIDGARVLLMHGDTLCTEDDAYQDFRSMVRTPSWQEAFLAKPLSERLSYVEELRRLSETQKQHKDMMIMDANEVAIESAFVRHQASLMVHGHTHRLATHTHTANATTCTRFVLGDWKETNSGGNFLSLSQGQWQRHTWHQP